MNTLVEQHASAIAAPTRVERFETVVIGAGQAGLSVGYHLARQDADFVILDRAATPGESWRTRWDSLQLFTPARYSSLPGMPFPAPPNHLPDKDEVAAYLTAYAARFELPVRGNAPVDALDWDGTRFRLTLGAQRIEADQVVVATGAFAKPMVPDGASRLAPRITQLTSLEYRNPFGLPAGPVLVVGAGNSGTQIALEVSRFRKVWLAGRETGYWPRRVLGRDLFDWIWPVITRLPLDTRLGRRITRGTGGDALIGIPRESIAAAGIVRVGRFTGATEGMPICGDEVLEPATIIWCTGLKPVHDWINVSHDTPGLHFVGLQQQRRIASALVGGVGADAELVAAAVMRGVAV
ncbi:MAG: NAD(P)-binding domain-containing protein [Gemmatimonadales bacterium]|nr:NAD(P)-binding domain-containing protein [Gemmatimonadales bacterium]